MRLLFSAETNFTHGFYARTFPEQSAIKGNINAVWLRSLTVGGHSDDGLRRSDVLVLHPRVVLVQELRQWRRFGEQLADHVAADVGRLLEPQDAEDLVLDAVEPHLFAVLPEVAGRALVPAVRQQPGGLVRLHGGGRREEDGETEEEQHPARCCDAVWSESEVSGLYGSLSGGRL